MDTNPQKLRAVTFREAVRLPGSSQTAFFIPAEDYPLTFYPLLGLIRGTLRPGVNPLPHQARTRYYGIGVVKDLELLEDPVETNVRETNGVLTVTQNVRSNPDGSFERVVDEPAPAAPPAPAEAPAAKRGRKPKAAASAPAAPPTTPTTPTTPIQPVITRPLPRTTAGTGPRGGNF